MPGFSFIHASDLHLDSPFSTLAGENPDLSSLLKSATFNAFENIIGLCIEKKVDFLVIAGDVFDGADRSLKAQVKFRDQLKSLDEAGIHSFVVHGNHDPLDSWAASLDWPSRVHLFSGSIETVPVLRNSEIIANIQGISYPARDEKRNLAAMFKKTGPAFHIGLLHANAGTNTGHEPYAPCSLEDLRSAEMDYWALGHVHTRRLLSEAGPYIAYSGNTQGRNINETGEKGCFLVTVEEDGTIDTQFFPTDKVRWHSVNIMIDGLRSEQELINTLNRACEDISIKGAGRSSIVRINLEGLSPLAKMLADPNNVKDLMEMARENGALLSPQVWIDRIESKSRLPFDLKTLAQREDFTGELLRLSNELSTNEQFEDVIKNEISDLFSSPKAHRFLDLPGRERLRELLGDAVMICLAELEDTDK